MNRLESFRREVNLNIALGNAELPVVDDQGHTPVLAALEDELLSTVLGRLRSIGGYANLFVREETGHVHFVAVVDSSSAVAVPDDDLSGPDGAPGPDATIGTFISYLKTQPNGVVLSADAVGHPATAQDHRNVDFAVA